jgi:neutral ceramidase
MKDGTVRFNQGRLNPDIVRPAGPTDPDVGIVLAYDRSAQHPFAGITVFAMHSDTVGGTEYSADYEFYLEQSLRTAFGEGFISAFGAGTCGDLNHIDVSKPSQLTGFPMAEQVGITLGQTVVRASGHLRVLDKPALAARSQTVSAQLQEVTPEELAEARAEAVKLSNPKTPMLTKVVAMKRLDLASRGRTWPMEIQVFRLDADTAIVCLPGELFVELGLAIKQGSPFRNTIVMSICNDRPSYIPTRKAFAEGSYEVTNSRVMPGTGEQLVETAVHLLHELKPTPESKP